MAPIPGGNDPMAGKILYILLLLGALALAAKVAVILIFAVLLAGLIFRPKETIGLLLLGGFLSALAAAPLPTLGVMAVLVTISLHFKKKEERAAAALALTADKTEPDDS